MSRFAIAAFVCCLAAACSSPKTSTPTKNTDTGTGTTAAGATVAPGPSGKMEIGEAPPVPAGFADADALQKAWQAGQIGLVNTEVERPEGVTEYTDLDYGNTDTPRRLLTLAVLEERKEAGPVMLVVPPGCWTGTTQCAMYQPWLYDLAKAGYLAGLVDYAAGNAAKTLENLSLAVRWLKGNAARYGGDPKRIVLLGFGDGAWAALSAAYTADGENTVNGVVDFYGPADLSAPCWAGNTALKAFSAGGEPGSPYKQVKKGVPPTLVFHGVLDTSIPVAQSDLLAQALQGAGVPFYFDRVEGWGRSLDLETRTNDRARYLVNAFVRQYVVQGQ